MTEEEDLLGLEDGDAELSVKINGLEYQASGWPALLLGVIALLLATAAYLLE